MKSSASSIKELQGWAYKQLENTVFNPDFESDLLIGHVLKKDRAFLYGHPDKKLSASQLAKLKQLVARRRKKEPFAYLIGQTEFFNLTLKVSPAVLVPRPETELLVEEALAILAKEKQITNVVDVGTGSGAIILAIAANTKGKRTFTGLDISTEALGIARQNAKLTGQKVLFKNSDLLSAHPLPATSYSLVTANLPYLEPKVARKKDLKHEPMVALTGGKGGAELIERLIEQFARQSKADDYLLLEIGADQGGAVKNLVKKYLPKAIVKIKKDYSGWDRTVIIKTK